VTLPLVSVNILAFNHRQYLAQCLDSVLAQTYAPLEITLVDNGSTDGAVEFVRQAYPQVRVIANDRNLGYSGGHNVGIRATVGEYVLLLNPDVYLTPTFVAEAVRVLESAADVGMVTGKLLLMDEAGNVTSRIDAAGTMIDRYRRNYERGHGEDDVGQYERVEPVFAAFGAAPLYRRAMLEDVQIAGEVFDQDLFTYREEVDLAWRAQARGWCCLYAPAAVAYHVHAYRPASRRNCPPWQRRLQFRNRYLMVIKNDTAGNLLRHLPFLLAYELAALGYVLLFEPELLKAYLEVLQLWPRMWRKRCWIQANRTIPAAALYHWFR